MKPFSEREIRALLLLLTIGLVSCGVWLAKRVHPGLFQKKAELVIDLAEPAVSPDITVHVVGPVNHPGLYQLPRGSRIADAIDAAGGTTDEADLSVLNQAAVLTDGRQVRVPSTRPPAQSASSPASQAQQLHLNIATAEQFEQLPGIGPVTAKRIIDYRDAQGGFSSVDELLNVKGIGPKTLERMRPYLIVY